MKQGSNQAIRFFVMESLRDWYKGGDRDKPVPKLIVGLFGGVAGMYTTTTHPYPKMVPPGIESGIFSSSAYSAHH